MHQQVWAKRAINMTGESPFGSPLVGGNGPSPFPPEFLAAQRALRRLERVPIQARIVWIDGMKSWTPATRARAIMDIHKQIEAEKRPYMKILGHFIDDDE